MDNRPGYMVRTGDLPSPCFNVRYVDEMFHLLSNERRSASNLDIGDLFTRWAHSGGDAADNQCSGIEIKQC